MDKLVVNRAGVGALAVAGVLSLMLSHAAPAGAQAKNDYNGIRVCTPEEVNYIETFNDPAANGAPSSLNDVPNGEAGDWLKEGTPQYEVAKQIYDFWTQEIGTSGAFAAGVVANVKQESNFVPNISEGGGRFSHPMATEPTHGGPGGGLYQFTPYSKYTGSPHFATGGWTVQPQSMFVWHSEFITGAVDAGMKNAPNLYGIEAPFDRTFTAIPKGKQGTPLVILDPNALITSNDPVRASKGFQVGYERPAQYHPEREKDAIAANKAFNKNNYPGDADKLAKTIPPTAVAHTAINALDTLGRYATGAMIPKNSKRSLVDLFASPCLLHEDGQVILNKKDAAEYARAVCSSSGAASSRGRNPGAGGGEQATIHNADKLVPDARKLAEDIAAAFPEIKEIGGWRPVDRHPDHPSGRAVDVMIPDYKGSGKKIGDEVNAFVHDNADKYNIEYTIWRQEYMPVGGGGNIMGDRGSDTLNHFDHVHVTVKGSESGGGNNSQTQAAKKSRVSHTNLNMSCGGQSGGKKGGSISPNPNGAAIGAEGTLSSLFGDTDGRSAPHDGLDIANAVGTPIYAIADGVVIDSGPATGYGNWIRIRHEDGSISEYGHQTKNHVKVGDTVKAGDHIADMGSEGFSTGPHLHLTIYDTDGKTEIDPVDWFNANGIDIKNEHGFQVTKELNK